jgi:hypothetical protein
MKHFQNIIALIACSFLAYSANAQTHFPKQSIYYYQVISELGDPMYWKADTLSFIDSVNGTESYSYAGKTIYVRHDSVYYNEGFKLVHVNYHLSEGDTFIKQIDNQTTVKYMVDSMQIINLGNANRKKMFVSPIRGEGNVTPYQTVEGVTDIPIGFPFHGFASVSGDYELKFICSDDYALTFEGSNMYPIIKEVNDSFCEVYHKLLGIEESLEMKMKVYPNPTCGALNIDLDKVHNHINLIVLAADGQEVFNQGFKFVSQVSFELAGSPGLYVIEIINEEGVVMRKKVCKI